VAVRPEICYGMLDQLDRTKQDFVCGRAGAKMGLNNNKIHFVGALAWFLAGWVLVAVCQGQHWPRFRGPNGQGHADTTQLPVKWGPQDYIWTTALPGSGHSSPVIWGQTIFVTSAEPSSATGFVLAVSLVDGRILWQRRYQLHSYRMNRLNSYAATSPAVAQDGLYVLWPGREKYLMVALDHQGNERWRRFFEGAKCQHGPGGSPIVYDRLVVFTIEHEQNLTEADGSWLALDRTTGQTLWRVVRKTGPKSSYSTPCVYVDANGKAVLVFTSRSHGITAVDPDTGQVVWEFPTAFPARVVSSPVLVDDLIVGTCGDGGSGKRLVAIRPAPAPWSPQLAYRIDDRSAVPYVPTPVAEKGLLFTFHDRGQVACLQGKTGRIFWRAKPAGRFYGSPICADGKLYAITTDGEVVVLRADAEYQLLAINSLGQASYATPAVAGARLILRSRSSLFCVGPNRGG